MYQSENLFVGKRRPYAESLENWTSYQLPLSSHTLVCQTGIKITDYGVSRLCLFY